ncbi:MAG: hypothetical protein D6769_01370, partial [Methanobacteriota archaeon]
AEPKTLLYGTKVPNLLLHIGVGEQLVESGASLSDILAQPFDKRLTAFFKGGLIKGRGRF